MANLYAKYSNQELIDCIENATAELTRRFTMLGISTLDASRISCQDPNNFDDSFDHDHRYGYPIHPPLRMPHDEEEPYHRLDAEFDNHWSASATM